MIEIKEEEGDRKRWEVKWIVHKQQRAEKADTQKVESWSVFLFVCLLRLGDTVQGWQAAEATPSVSLHLTLDDTDHVCRTDKDKERQVKDIRQRHSRKPCVFVKQRKNKHTAKTLQNKFHSRLWCISVNSSLFFVT